jgi:uncharacterized protein (DUF1015 family)
MVDIRPFRAIRYTELAGAPKNLITQPYDKIDPEMQGVYYGKSIYNFCRIILPIESDKYKIAQHRFHEWLRKGLLEKDNEPAVFVCRQEFTLDGKKLARTGLIAALRLYDYDEQMVFPHETTYSAPKTDRLNMMRQVQKDLEPVFLIFSDTEGTTQSFFKEVSNTKPELMVEDSFGIKHTIWRVAEPKKIRLLQETLEPKKLVITDGHHRYESAIAYRDERRPTEKGWTTDSAFNFHMSLLVPIQDEGLLALPAHRLLKHHALTDEQVSMLDRFFTVTEIDSTVKSLESFLKSNQNEHSFCIYTGTKAFGIVLKHEAAVYEFVSSSSSKDTKLFDVVILRDVIFKAILKAGDLKMDEDIIYERWTSKAVERVDRGEVKLAFFVNPIAPKVVWQIAQQHERIPEKSTDFYPKPVSGLVIMDISPGEKLVVK